MRAIEFPQRSPAVLALGFRPFFLLAGVLALVYLGIWGVAWNLGALPQGYYPGLIWHSHELLFGYVPAVIAGFLLTAVRNWTGLATPSGGSLGLLVLVWLLGRVAPWFPALPPGLLALLDLAFLPALAVVLAVPVVRTRQWRNLVFVVILAGMAIGNALVHLSLMGGGGLGRVGLYGALYLILIVIGVIAGRVLPFFIERGLDDVSVRRRPWLDTAALVGLPLFMVVELIASLSVASGVLAAILAGLHLWRLADWHHPRVWRVPLLWVLFLGYAWLPLGFALYAAAAFGVIGPLLAVHAWTAGTIGVLTIGMMARVALGHTGRPLKPAPLTVAAFVLINAAAAVRVLLPLLWPSAYSGLILASSLLWSAAFLAFLIVYAPILMRPRVDGRPG